MEGTPRGMGKFAMQLVDPLIDAGQLVGLSPGQGDTPRAFPMCRSRFGLYPLWEQCVLPRLATAAGVDALLCPYNTGPMARVKGQYRIAIIHDLIFMDETPSEQRGSAYQRFGRQYRRRVVPTIARQADAVVTVSRHSMEQLVERLGVDERKITVLPNAVPDQWIDGASRAAAARQNAFLAVSGDAPSKNLAGLLAAFAEATHQLPSDFRLWIVGVPATSRDKFRTIAAANGVIDRVDFFGLLSEAELQGLYCTARALILPSLNEGFGIPLIEAMLSGLPIAASNAGAVPEVVAGAALLFSPRDTAAMAGQMCRLADEVALCNQLAAAGKVRGESFMASRVRPAVERFWAQVAQSL